MNVAVIGLGLIGGSWATALHILEPEWRLVGWDADERALAGALERDAVTDTAASAAEAVRGADLVLIATPVLAVRTTLEAIAPHLRPGAIVTDVASTKAQVVAWARALLPAGVHFIGGHPMAGSERGGIAHADPTLFRGAVFCLTPAEETPQAANELLERLYGRMGARIRRMSPEAHDRAVAAVSHAPFLIAFALAAQTAEDADAELLRLVAASGYRDMTRLAAGTPEVYRDICLTNASAIRERLVSFADRLRAIADELEDPEALLAFMTRAKAERDAWWADWSARRGEARPS